MAKLKKKEIPDFKKKYSAVAKFKPQRFFDLGDVFTDACSVTGPAMGHLNMFLGHTDTGKSQPLTSNILTPKGWVKMGNIKVGDEIIGSDGDKQVVLGVYPQGKRPVYKIKISDGSEVLCDEEHLWSVNLYNDRNRRVKYNNRTKLQSDHSYKTFTTKELIPNIKVGSRKDNNYQLPNLKPVIFETTKELNIDPYVLGCFIGDGSFGRKYDIVRISTKDPEILNEIENTEHFRRFINRERQFDVGGVITTRQLTTITLNNDFKCELRELGLNGNTLNKFIPLDYIYSASINDRIELLRGLMDTDGTVDKRSGTAYYSTSSKKLSENFIELVRSLGGICNISEKHPTYVYKGKKKKGNKNYVISVRLNGIIPFKLERKKILYKSHNNVSRVITDIKFSHYDECQCIKVENADCLYVTDNYILTHNTSALILTMIDAQKKGILPVIIVTEQKWSFEHAKLMGFQCEETVDTETGEVDWSGDYIFRNDFDYIEEITDFINLLLTAQDKGEIDQDLLFVWDSVGSVPCKMTFEGKGGKQHNAGVLADKIGMGLNQRITGSRRVEKKYTNTLLIVNQPWVEPADNKWGQPKIKAKGGEAIWLNSTLVFRFGNEKNAGTSKIWITKNTRKVDIATRSKISIMKNHVNGLGFSDGKIMVTAHGFMKLREKGDEDISKKLYVKEHLDYISQLFGEKITDVSEIDFATPSVEE